MTIILQGYTYGNVILQGYYAGAEQVEPLLIVEDGDGVLYANSYVTYEEALKYAKSRGKGSLFTDEETTEEYLIRATDYLQTLTFEGSPVYVEQSLSWPRECAYIGDLRIPNDQIPQVLKSAQIEVALVIATGLDPLGVTSGPFVTEETVGPLTTKYSDKFGFGVVEMPIVDALLAQLTGNLGGLRVFRV